MTGTGSHVVLKEKLLSSLKNRSWAQEDVKPRRKRGLKVQSPIGAAGGSPWSKNNTKLINTFYLSYTFFHNNNKFLFDRSVPIVSLVSIRVGEEGGRIYHSFVAD